MLKPDMMVVEPTALIGSGRAGDTAYVKAAVGAVRQVDPTIGVLVGGGVSNAEAVYRIIKAGADATGCSSGIATASDPEALVHEMLAAVRQAWDERALQEK